MSSRFPMWSWFLLAILTAVLAKREEEDVMMVQRLTASKALSLAAREACGPPVKWPCDNEIIASFPLQVINSNKSDCDSGAANFDRLDLSTGEYTPLCSVPGHCFNGCGISADNEIFCREVRGGRRGSNFVRVDCKLNTTEADAGLPITPVVGELCFFGKIPGTYAAQFDVDGSYWFKADRTVGNDTEGEILELTNAKLDLEQGAGEQVYVVGCWRDIVFLQQVSGDLTGVEPIELTMVGADPSGNSGAQWLFNGSVYCAYNDGTSGVIEIMLNQTYLNSATTGTIFAAKVNGSAETNSNDGLNCLNAASPFPPAPPITSTTSTTSTSTSTSTTRRNDDPPPPGATTTEVGVGEGDPHIHTLDGQHYLLLNQGSFMFWHFSGIEAETLTGQKFVKKVPVDFKVYTHYSGHYSYTKGLLLLDSSGLHERSLELTSESCRWLTKTTPEQSWRGVDGPEVLSSPDSDGDEMTAFDLKTSKGQKMHVELLMKTQQGFKTVGKLFATCKPGHHLNVKVKMFSQDEVRLVKGQLGSHSAAEKPGVARFFQESGQELRMDQDLETKTDWVQLGGSPGGSTYLREVDDEGPAVLKSCTQQDKDEAKTICQKHLGTSDSDAKMSGSTDFEDVQRQQDVHNFQETFSDCIFDVCVGGGEAAAELAAEILNAF